MRRFDDQVAVVTGAASGLGRQLAADLAARGATVVGVDLDAEGAAARGVAGRGCDVADADHYRALLAEVEADAGRIDLVANVAGIDQPTSVRSTPPAVFARIMAVNFGAVLTSTLAVVPAMVARGHGYVLNVSSDSVRSPLAGEVAYLASKGALTSFTESAALEVKAAGVHLHVLYPGFVPTAMGLASLEHGMAPPPRLTRRTAAQVSALALDRLGGAAIEINAVRSVTVMPLVRTLFPAAYRKMMAGRAMPVDD